MNNGSFHDLFESQRAGGKKRDLWHRSSGMRGLDTFLTRISDNPQMIHSSIDLYLCCLSNLMKFRHAI